MIPTVMFFSSAIIDTTAFRLFLAQLGVAVQPPEYPLRAGHWVRGEESLLISLRLDWREEFGENHPMLVTVHQMFGTAPQTCVIVDFTLSEGSARLAVEFAHAINHRWPVIAIDEAQRMYDGTGITRLLEQGHGFSLTTTGEPLV